MIQGISVKKYMGYNEDKAIIEMDLKLSGTYSFNEARLLATGTTKDKKEFSGEEHPIQFAVVGGSQYVGIINLWENENDLMFRDVWEYGCDEPELQDIRFLSKEEAKKLIISLCMLYLSIQLKNQRISY